jgi:hypothetical protein
MVQSAMARLREANHAAVFDTFRRAFDELGNLAPPSVIGTAAPPARPRTDLERARDRGTIVRWNTLGRLEREP